MKAGADAAPKTTTAQHTNKNATSSKNEEKPFFAPAPPRVQTKLKVGGPNDPAEKEADHMADKVMRMPADKVQRKEDTTIQRKGEGTPVTATNEIGEGIRQQSSGGFSLSDDTRGFMESRFNADFSNVKIHTGPESAQLNDQVGAKAFTYQNHIFFNNNQYQPEAPSGKQLLAHELTHTIQQGQSVQRSAAPEKAGASKAVSSAGAVNSAANTTTAPAATMAPQIQRFLGIDIPSWQDVLDWLAEKAYNIPGYRMFTIVIGVNPINGQTADRSAANILRAIVEFLPGGHVITQALEKYSVFEKAGSWVEAQLARFSGLMGQVKSGVSQFMSDLSFIDVIVHPVRTWERAVDIFAKPVSDIISFIKSIFQAIFQFVRDAVLVPLAELASKAPAFDLLCAIIGRNPITGVAVPRNADTLIGGFMKMIGREDIWENIKKGNAIQRAFTWFQNAMKGLVALVTSFPEQFLAMLRSLEIMDFIILPNLFKKVFGVFGSFAKSFFDWALNTIFDLLEIIFMVVAPGAMPYLTKVRSAFKGILEKPMVFLGHLVGAVKLGFNQFKDKIGKWLKDALLKWLLGSLAGADLYIPKSFALSELLKLGLSVFGLTYKNFRVKLVKAIGETAVAAMETGFDILKTLVTEGPAAAWDKIQDKINELKDQFISQVTTFVTVTIVQTAITKLLTSLNPVGAFIQAIIAIYDTIMFVIQKIKQIAQVGLAVVDSIVEISSGNIGKAANKVESVLGNLLSLAISFLANFLHLGKISDKIVEILNKLRAPVFAAMDKVIAWIMNVGKKFLGTVKSKVLGWLGITKTFTGKDNETHTVSFKGKDENAAIYVASTPKIVDIYLSELEAEPKNKGHVATARGLLVEIATLKRTNPGEDKLKQDKLKLDIQAKINTLGDTLALMTSAGGTDTGMTPALELTFTKGIDPPQPEEYARQLQMQQTAINNVTIATWIAGRSTFEQMGRDPLGSTKIQEYRAKVRARLQTRYYFQNNIKGKPTPAQEALADQYASLQLKDTAALHFLDQVAGGDGTEFKKALGNTKVNSSIGSGWKSHIQPIMDRIKKIQPAALKTAKMNLTLK